MNHKIIALILQVLKVAGSGLSHYGNEINSDNATHKQEKAEESVTDGGPNNSGSRLSREIPTHLVHENYFLGTE